MVFASVLPCTVLDLRRGGDSNPRYPLGVQRLSRAPDSATLAPLPFPAPPRTASPVHTKRVGLVLSRAAWGGKGYVTGEGGIRTPGTASGSTVFKTASFDHSDTSPKRMEAWLPAGHNSPSESPPSRSTGICHYTHGPGLCQQNARLGQNGGQSERSLPVRRRNPGTEPREGMPHRAASR